MLYRPPNSTSPLNTIYDILNDFHDKNNLIILGDFNLNPNSLTFKNILNDLNLKQHIIDPTHSKGNTLDLIITRNSQNKIHTNVGARITDHNIINLYLNLIKPKQIIKYITYRKLHNIDTLEYSNDLHKLTIVDYDNTDATAKHIQQHLTTILDKNAPLRTTKVHLRSTNAWWNTELSELHRIIRKKELIWRKNKNTINYNDYMYHRKKYFKEIKITKTIFYQNKITSEKNNMKQLYKTFDGLLNVKEKTECPIHNESFANFFIDKIIKIYNEIEFNSDNNLRDKYIDTLKKPTCISEAIPTITSTYIERLIRLTHFKTNIYIDCMTPQLLKLNIRFISLIYSNLINKCITHNNFQLSLSLKHSIITPIIKKTSLDYSIPNNYRPISNLSLLSKIFERIIVTHIIKHITANSLDNTMQSAYKPYHNTETLLLNLTNYISHNIKNNRFVILILLDLTAAFVTINHNILFAKLQSIGIHNTIIQLIKSYLTERTFNIKSDKLSTIFKCSQIGVPQGSVLGPLLFNIYIYPIST